ncbi:MAG TPA: dihydrodipicolinate reductase [Desulfobacterales bacterium]|nr:dihydrodipicolinate reductase [Desulfobacterales bacterium]
MQPITVMVNGIPGKVACTVAGHVQKDRRFRLIPCSFTGPEIQEHAYALEGTAIRLIRPDGREAALRELRQTHGDFLSVDYTHPSAVNANADFYCRHGLPFVMGTTGGDRQQLEETVRSSGIAAVVAPNMAKQIVGFQAMTEYAAQTFPGLFKGYSLAIRESHQKGKADTSGTAKAMVRYFNRLGVSFSEEQIAMERDPQVQSSRWGVPEQYLTGHGWHTYTLVSADKTVRFEFTHNINGRDIYVQGTLDALLYLEKKIAAGARGQLYTMIDVLKGA